jgi:hypothetical protein
MAVACSCASIVISLGRNLDVSQQSATPDGSIEWLSSQHLSVAEFDAYEDVMNNQNAIEAGAEVALRAVL